MSVKRRVKRIAKKKGLQIKGLELMSANIPRKEWLIKRQTGLGGSDMSVIFQMNDRFSLIELFYQKLGLNFSATEGHNNYTLWGTLLEDTVRDMAQYYDFETGTYIENFEHGIKLRDIVEFPYMVRNKDYPWLLANVDGLENYNALKRRADSIAEMKTISRQSSEKWENGLPVYYIIQVHHYSTVLKPMLYYPEIARIFVLQDGRDYWGREIPISQTIVDEMLQRSYDFWETLEQGKYIMATAINENQMRLGLQEIEPEPDHTKAYADFVSKLQVKKDNYQIIQGGQSEFELGLQYLKAHEEAKVTAKIKQKLGNELRGRMRQLDADVIDFGPNGRIKFSNRLYVNIK